MATTGIVAREIPRTPARQAEQILRSELAAALALLRDLEPSDWHRPTACGGWTVCDVVAHMIGQPEGICRPDRLIRRVRHARRAGRIGILDRANAAQVHDRARTPPAQLIAELDRWTCRAVRVARRTPAPIRRRMRLGLYFPDEAARLPDDSFDYLLRVLAARDAWMHRLDIAAATGRTPVVGSHDALIVEQVVHDLALAWSGPSVVLDLSGPAGGRWTLEPV